jgi:hypothetical protein
VLSTCLFAPCCSPRAYGRDLKAIRADLDVYKNVERLERDMEKLKKDVVGQSFKISCRNKRVSIRAR